MEAEVTELSGVVRRVRDPEHRSTHRNGYRERRTGYQGGQPPALLVPQGP